MKRMSSYEYYKNLPYSDKNKTAWQYYDETSWFRSGTIVDLFFDLIFSDSILSLILRIVFGFQILYLIGIILMIIWASIAQFM